MRSMLMMVFLSLLLVLPIRPHAQLGPAGAEARAPITVAISRLAKPGCEAELEDTIRAVMAARIGFEGHLDTKVIRPASPRDRQYQIFLTFDDLDSWDEWRSTPEAARWRARLDGLTDGPADYQVATGMERWFITPSTSDLRFPDRAKQVAVTWMTVFPLVLGINTVTGPLLVGVQPVIRTLVMTAIMVPTMTLVAIPTMSRLFEDWLYPRPDTCVP